MIDKWQQREAKIGRTNIGRLMDKTSDGQLKSVQSRHLKHLITVCTVRIQSQNIPDAVCSKQRSKTHLLCYFSAQNLGAGCCQSWFLVFFWQVYLPWYPPHSFVMSTMPKMCPTGFKTFNGSKSFDWKWYTFLNIFQYMYMFSNSLVHSYCDN